jgi:hypothetical protein
MNRRKALRCHVMKLPTSYGDTPACPRLLWTQGGLTAAAPFAIVGIDIVCLNVF